MRRSRILALPHRSVSSASPHASNRPRQRVCAPDVGPAPSHMAARAQFSDPAMIVNGQDEPYYSQLLGRPRAADQAMSGLLLCRPASREIPARK
jgi:hypothetical protein